MFPLREHVRTETNITRSLSKQLVEILENMEAFTLKLLEKIVVGCAEVTSSLPPSIRRNSL